MLKLFQFLRNRPRNVLLIKCPWCREIGNALCCCTCAVFPNVRRWLAVVLETNHHKLSTFVRFDGGLPQLRMYGTPKGSLERQQEVRW